MSDSDSDLNEWMNSCTNKRIVANFKKKTPLAPLMNSCKTVPDCNDRQGCSLAEEAISLSPTEKTVLSVEIEPNNQENTIDRCDVRSSQITFPPQIDLTIPDNLPDICLIPSAIDLVPTGPNNVELSFWSYDSSVDKTKKHRYNTRSKPRNIVASSATAIPSDDTDIVSLNNSNTNKRASRFRKNAKRNKKASSTTDSPFHNLNSTCEIITINNPDNAKSIDEIQKENLNYETSIKVVWKSVNVIRIPIRRFQKLNDVFLHLMKLEQVPLDQIFLTFRGVPVKPSDTPDSLDLTICDFLEGGIVKKSSTVKSIPERGSEYFLSFQYGDKKIIRLVTNKNESMQKLMLKFSEQIEKPLSSIRFEVDGDEISGSDTPGTLKLEKGEIIDVLL